MIFTGWKYTLTTDPTGQFILEKKRNALKMDPSRILLSGTVKTKLLATESSSYNRVRLQLAAYHLTVLWKIQNTDKICSAWCNVHEKYLHLKYWGHKEHDTTYGINTPLFFSSVNVAVVKSVAASTQPVPFIFALSPAAIYSRDTSASVLTF